jgi:hypothetical protein
LTSTSWSLEAYLHPHLESGAPNRVIALSLTRERVRVRVIGARHNNPYVSSGLNR